jgi:hypothetical protein
MELLPDLDAVVFAFKNLPCASPILRLLVDSYYLHYDQEIHTENEPHGPTPFPYEFLMRFILRHLEIKEGLVREKLDACDYHDHGSDRERKNCEI